MSHLISFIFASLLALALSMGYHFDLIMPLPVSLILIAVFVSVGLFIRFSQFSILTRLMLVSFSMPFIHGVEHLDFDYRSKPQFLWGLTANAYNLNEQVVARLFMVGSIGVIAFVSGFFLAKAFEKKSLVPLSAKTATTLTIPSFIFVILVGVFFTWVDTPNQTIFEANYTEAEKAITSTLNLNTGWLISYIFISIAFIDALFESTALRKKLKVAAVSVSSLLIIIYFQFMRGDRKCTGLIAALLGIYLCQRDQFHSVSNLKDRIRRSAILNRKRLILGITVLIAFVAMQLVGFIRSQSVNRQLSEVVGEQASQLHVFAGTWSAALETPLSVVGDFYYDRMPLKWGETYVDYFLSLPPGIITRFFGIERPIEGDHGPAWEMRYGLGGTHGLVVPLMNFGILGVVYIVMLFGFLIGKLELWANREQSFSAQLFYACVLIEAPFWFWYGDLYMIRAIMAYFVFFGVYSLLPKTKGVLTPCAE